MYDICTIGLITLDKVVTPSAVRYMPGGTSFYFSKALQFFDINYALITSLAAEESYIVDELSASGMRVHVRNSEFTVHFENTYTQDSDHREQRVLHASVSFGIDTIFNEVPARIYHLGPLLSGDIPVPLIACLSKKGEVSLDVQGYLRYVRSGKVLYRDWEEKRQVLPAVTFLKANEFEMEIITGTRHIREGARYLAGLGVREVIITLGSKGSVIYSGGDFYEIPAYYPPYVEDATGCGDTYMAGYLVKRVRGESIREAGEFGSAMAALKVALSGPFNGSESDVEKVIKSACKIMN